MKSQSYELIYSQNQAVRRYPEGDVAAFASSLEYPRILLDLGTGTGRNLLPLLCKVVANGMVVGADIAQSGMDIISNWAIGLGAIKLDKKQLTVDEGLTIGDSGIPTDDVIFFRIPRHENVSYLGPCGLFQRSTIILPKFQTTS